jgi:V/A-type H+-transporting ATPase subunit I
MNAGFLSREGDGLFCQPTEGGILIPLGERMFYPQEMTEIEIIVPERDALAVTRELADQGIFHQLDASYLSSEAGTNSTDAWQAQSAAYTALERRLVSIMQALDVEEGPLPPADQSPTIEVEEVRSDVEQLEREVTVALKDLNEEQKKLEQLKDYLQQLAPVSDIDIDVSTLRDPRYTFSMLGIMPTDSVERLQTSLARIPFVLVTLRQDSRRSVVWLLGTQRNADILDRAARSAYLNPLSLPGAYRGTPSQIMEAIQADIEHLQRQISAQRGVMTELHDVRKEQLQMLLWRVRASRLLADVMTRYGKLRYTYLIVGWVPLSSLESLSRRLRQISGEILIETTPSKRGSAGQNVPVSLENPGILRAFQQLVTTYARPRYEEIDPTLLITLTFPLLFGAMFGDVGHGLVLALLGGVLASRRVPALRGFAGLGIVVTICGLVATLFGFLYGSVFGMEDVLPALWIRPMESIMQILIVAIGAGIVLLSTGFLIGILNAWVARDWSRLLFGHNGVAGLALYWSLVGFAAKALIGSLPVPVQVITVVAVVAGFVVMFSEVLGRLVQGHRPLIEGSIGTYAVQAVFELFETLISFLSNSLSYVRVGAFAVAHGGLSAVVFILAEMVSPTRGIGYWVVVALGNLFVIGFEGLIVGIQTLRLEYYEFFSKFFTGGGTSYVPLTTFPKAGQ